MKVKFCVTLLAVLLVSQAASANTIASSSMWFHENSVGELTAFVDSSGYFGYTGTIAAVDESSYGGYIGANSDGVAGFDVYAKEGGTAWYDTLGSGSSYTSGVIGSAHDAYLGAGGWGSFYNPDVADWYNYQLRLTADHWYLEYNGNVGNDGILTGAAAAPMSGTLEWIANGVAIAKETDTGQYYTGMGTPENPGGAAGFIGGSGAGYWDMDWSWGSEAIPLEHSTFLLDVRPMSNTLGISLKPIPAPGAILLGSIGIGLVGYLRRRRSL